MVTVEQVMQLDIIKKQLTLLSGKRGLKKTINYITIMEAPDFYEWVSGGEFVLTSWYAYSSNSIGQEHAFCELAKKISCIGIKVDRFLKEVPPELIELADKYEVPLFAIKRETKFREIINAVAAEVQNAQANLLLKVQSHYNDLMKSALASDGFSPILRTTAKNSGKRCFCFNAMGEYLGCSYPSGGDTAALAAEAKEFYQKQKNHIYDYNGCIRFKVNEYEIFLCVARRFLLGFLILVSDSEEEELSEPAVLIAQQTVSVLSLKLMERYGLAQKRMAQLLEHIKNGASVVDELDFLGLKWRKKLLYAARLCGKEQNIVNLLSESKFLKSTDKLLSIIDGKDIVFIGTHDTHKQGEITELLQNLWSWLEEKKQSQQVVLTIGCRVANVTDLGESLYLANNTAKAALQVGTYGCVESRDWLLSSVIINQAASVELRQITKIVLEPILKHDENYKLGLFETLRALVVTGKPDLAAASLHIHVNTLRYRLAKIRDITGYDPNALTQLNILKAAVLLGQMQKNKKTTV